MMLWILGVVSGLVVLVICIRALLEMLIIGGIGLSYLLSWIEDQLKTNSQLAWALAGCSFLGAVVLLAYLLR